MKKSDIKVGKRYTDGKGGIRLVIAEGSQYVLYASQEETDNLRYRIEAKVRGPYLVGEERNSTRTSFAAWAKREVSDEEITK